MPNLTIASWNIYFSHKLVTGSDTLRIPGGADGKRARQVAQIVKDIDPDLLGVIECMPAPKLRYFVKELLGSGYKVLVEGGSSRLNLGLIYRDSALAVNKVSFNGSPWKARLGDDSRKRTYKFTRKPLIAKVRHKSSGKEIVVAVVHPKSKKAYSTDPDERREEEKDNRKRVVAEGLRLHETMWSKASQGAPFDRFLVMGDINDGPGFDKYEAQILKSGVEAHIGRVYEPDKVLHSFVDLSEDGGTPTTPASWGAPQLDHMLYTHDLAHGAGKPSVVANSGRVRSDLVNFSAGSGKRKDSDHIPVQLTVRV